MITDKENKIIVEALTKMRDSAQSQVGAAFGYDSRSELERLVKAISELDALISRHTPKQPTKNEAVFDKIQELFSKRHGRNWRFTDAGRGNIIQVLNEEYPE